MAPQPVSAARQRAEAMTGDASLVTGPLAGHHHETYVLSLPDGGGPIKVREPRSPILWFDRRCFRSEEELLRALKPYVPQVPGIVEVEGVGFQRFIEGRTLGAGHQDRRDRRDGRDRREGRRVPDAVLDQIVGLFRSLVTVTPGMLPVERRCSPEDAPQDGDSDGFLRRLVVFIADQVYERNRAEFGGLFRDLGVVDETLTRLEKNVSGLTQRPFSLLHADLHRHNIVIDPRGSLWAIDWELAMVGDPLYDLATHLYLMRYPVDQERRLIGAWCDTVESVRPGASRAWRRDLPLIMDFKRAQSVFTDVIRVALALCHPSGLRWADLPRAAGELERVILAAAVPLGLDEIPGRVRITRALIKWHSRPAARRPVLRTLTP
ncbi:phosphotransferase [Streptomyces ziwulingensis]|uniref:Phosphotransferase n=1 Tax=Streptomyces ziwulingensis TaxID=1045501 RepID=A0ABP9AXS5_9ACTN